MPLMNKGKENILLEQVYLSDTELYYTNFSNITGNKIVIEEDEVHHILKVMRHEKDDEIYVTSGTGIIWLSRIKEIGKKNVICEIIDEIKYPKPDFQQITFCLPLMKSNERLEFAVEKLIEIGFTEFLIYTSERGSSRSIKLSRLEKIALAAMKQSLRAFLPEIKYAGTLQDIFRIDGIKIIFDQKSEVHAENHFKNSTKDIQKHFLVIGPESGFSEKENFLFENSVRLKLTENRLRTETAAISAGVIISQIINNSKI